MLKNRKMVNLVFLFTMLSALCSITISAQSLPPEVGSYYCYTTGLANDIYANNPIAVQPAFFGDIVMDGKGNYKLTQRNQIGSYIFNKTSSKLTFTGDLSVMTVSEYSRDRKSVV